METVSASDLARAWGVSPRYVQRLLARGKIPGAKLVQRRWMIPANAQRPRTGHGAPRYMTCGLICAATPLPSARADSARQLPEDDGFQAQYAAERCYLRGDFQAVKAYYSALPCDSPEWFCAANIAVAAAMSTRDYPLFSQIRSAVKDAAERDGSARTARAAAMLPALTAVCMNAPDMAPDWLRAGDFSAFEADARPFLVFLRAKYLQATRAYAEMLATSRTALALCANPDAPTMMDLYHTTLCACASYALGRMGDACAYLNDSVRLCAAGDYVTPLGEYATCTGGLMQIALKRAPAGFEARVLAHIRETLNNWLFFHNEFTRDNASLALSVREYQLALLLKEGKTYDQAAEQLCLSLGRVKNLVGVIYEKLGIARKSEIGRYIV